MVVNSNGRCIGNQSSDIMIDINDEVDWII